MHNISLTHLLTLLFCFCLQIWEVLRMGNEPKPYPKEKEPLYRRLAFAVFLNHRLPGSETDAKSLPAVECEFLNLLGSFFAIPSLSFSFRKQFDCTWLFLRNLCSCISSLEIRTLLYCLQVCFWMCVWACGGVSLLLYSIRIYWLASMSSLRNLYKLWGDKGWTSFCSPVFVTIHPSIHP